MMAIKLHPSLSVPPGRWRRDELAELHGLSVTEVAKKLRVTRRAMSDLLGGGAGLSAEMAIPIEKGSGCARIR